MKKNNIKKITLTAVFAAIAVVGSLFSFPVFGSKCAPIQHLVNVICAVFLGPVYGVICAFVSSLIRNLMALGTPLAFPGSMCGALLAGVLYKAVKKRWGAYLGEIAGTALLDGMLAYPVATLILGNKEAAVFSFVVPFLISTAAGTIIAIVVLEIMAKSGILSILKGKLED